MDIITEEFCCDLEACKGKCCIIGDAGAPVTMDEVMELENVLDETWDDLSASAQAVIDKQGVAYTDEEGDLAGKTSWCKPISCALYPIRVKELKNGLTALNYHQWDICIDGRRKGRELHMPVYKFLREPLIRRFGQEWYDELCVVAEEVKKQLM